MKTKHIISTLLFSILCMLTVSCQKEVDGSNIIPDGNGGLTLRNVVMEDSSEITVIGTKSFGMDITTFQVDIIDSTKKVVKHFDSYQEMLDGNRPMVILPVGSYTIRAYSCLPKNGEYDAPYFMGEQDFEIEDKMVTSIDKMKCKFCSVAVDIRMSDSFNYLFKDNYTIVVENGNGGKMTYTKENKGQVMYFDRVGESFKLSVTVQANNMEQAYPTRVYYVKNGSKAPSKKEYYIITFDGEKPSTKVSF